jgi:hypothetical protein
VPHIHDGIRHLAVLGFVSAVDEEKTMNIRARYAAGNYRRKETVARAMASEMKNDWPRALMILMAVEYATLAEQADALDKKCSIFTLAGWRLK